MPVTGIPGGEISDAWEMAYQAGKMDAQGHGVGSHVDQCDAAKQMADVETHLVDQAQAVLSSYARGLMEVGVPSDQAWSEAHAKYDGQVECYQEGRDHAKAVVYGEDYTHSDPSYAAACDT